MYLTGLHTTMAACWFDSTFYRVRHAQLQTCNTCTVCTARSHSHVGSYLIWKSGIEHSPSAMRQPIRHCRKKVRNAKGKAFAMQRRAWVSVRRTPPKWSETDCEGRARRATTESHDARLAAKRGTRSFLSHIHSGLSE